MEYFQELLDRSTGRIETRSKGDWITVTELGESYGVGPRKVRAVLHHMGVLAQEGRKYRLLRRLADEGFGRRHDRVKSGYAFDVISPSGQALIAAAWSQTLQDYGAQCLAHRSVPAIRAALDAFSTTRSVPLSTQEEVCWIEDHFRDVAHRTIAMILEVSPALVVRYAQKRSADRDYRKRRMLEELPAVASRLPDLLKMTAAGPVPLSED